MKGTWQTTEGGGSSVLLAAAVIAAAVIAVPVVAIVAHLLEVLAVILGAIILTVMAGGISYAFYRARHPGAAPGWLAERIRAAHLPPAGGRPAGTLPAPQARAIEPPRQHELHLHFHGADPGDVAEALRRVNREHE